MRVLILSFLIFLYVTQLTAQTKTKVKEVPYTIGDREFKGELVYDPLLKSVRSGVLVLHDIWGIDDHVRDKATKLAELGHVVLIADLYGKDPKVTTKEDSLVMAESLLEDKTILLERVMFSFDMLKKQNKVDHCYPEHL